VEQTSKWHIGFKVGKIMGMNESTFIRSNSINSSCQRGEYGELVMPANCIWDLNMARL
jgi:hypothetical protein